MQYGYFDDKNKEYVITRPDTPTPWMNYLGQGGYGGIISNTAGGVSFDRDPQQRRVLRYRYNNLPMDRPGRYIYIRDMASGEYWSPSWQPVLRDLTHYECRHGMGYTRIKGVYGDIAAETLYFVPLKKSYEIWRFRVRNDSATKRELKIFTYVEFCYPSVRSDVMGDWPRMKTWGECSDNIALIDYISSFRQSHPVWQEPCLYFSADTPVEGYDLSLEDFIGPYRSESNPIALENGRCTDSSIYSDNAAGCLCLPVTLAPGEEKTINFILGASDDKEAIPGIVKSAFAIGAIDRDFAELNRHWEEYLSSYQITTPDEDVNRILNIWNQYQCKTTFDWSRYISLYERGFDRGYGFRDSMQDPLGVMYRIPGEAKERIKLLLAIQKNRGDTLSVYYPFHKTAEGGGRSDDHLWSVFSVCCYIKETCDTDFLDEMVPYHDVGEGTVLEHIEKAVRFTLDHTGPHGIPLMLQNDWNDSLSPIADMGGPVESVFVFFQLGHAVKELIGLYAYMNLDEKRKWAEGVYADLRTRLDAVWDDEWFIRAFNKYGEKFGTHEDEYNQIYLNPQSWAVLSGLPERGRMVKAFDAVRRHLRTDWGLVLNSPAPNEFDFEKKYYTPFPAGARENGGIFYHSNPWAIMAETILGRNEYAYDYYQAMLPTRRNVHADLTKVEPYVYCQNMLGPQHPRFGAAYNSWLSGTAAWSFFTATQYILGIRPDYDGLLIDPCLPEEWDEVRIERTFRGVLIKVTIQNVHKGAKGTGILYIDGVPVEGNRIRTEVLEGKHSIDAAFII